MKVAIIGGGITGATLAHLFSTQGADVTVFDSGGFGMAATNVGFAWVNCSTEVPAYYRLKIDANRRWREMQAELASCQFLHLNGHVEWSTNANEVLDAYGSDGQLLDGPPASPQERLRQKVAWLGDAGFGARMIDAAELQRMEPGIKLPDSFTEAGYYPQEGWLSPHLAVGALMQSARLHGATLRPHTPVLGIASRNGKATGVRLAVGSEVDADVVIVAAGAQSAEVLGSVGAPLPLAGTDGMTAITTPIASTLRSVVHTDELSMRPDGGGRLMIRNHTFDRVVSAQHTLEDVSDVMADLMRRTTDLIPAAREAIVAEMRVGHRPIPADGFPVIGFVRGVEGVYVAISHGAVTLAPVMAEIAVAEVLEGTEDARAAEFRHDRFI